MSQKIICKPLFFIILPCPLCHFRGMPVLVHYLLRTCKCPWSGLMLWEYRRCLYSACLKGRHFNVSFIPYLLCSALLVQREGQDPWAESFGSMSPGLHWSFFQKVISYSRIGPQTNLWVCKGSWVESVRSPLIPLLFLSAWQGGKDCLCWGRSREMQEFFVRRTTGQ